MFDDPGSVEVARLTGCKNFSGVAVIDEHTVEAVDWGVTLKTDRAVPDHTKSIGYRAHCFVPVWGETQDNCIKCDLVRVDDLPFEKNYYVRSLKEEEPICWFVQGEEQRVIERRGLPDHLRLSEKNILFLE